MRRLYFLLAAGTIVLGVVHIAATPRAFPRLSSAAVWFASGGLAMMLTGALNLLRRVYGDFAPGLRRVCLAANVVMTAFAVLAGYAGHASVAEFVVVLSLVGGATVLSVMPAAQQPVSVTSLGGHGAAV